MKLIVAVDANWGIGCKNELLVRIPSDQRFFRETTTGNVVVMGRKTLESLPQKQPLQNRINIILSGNKAFKVKGATVVNSIEELLKELKKYNDNDIFIAGGESLYKQMLPYCDTAHVTKIDYEYQADTYCPDLDKMPEWEIVADSEEQTYFDLEYVFLKYKKKK